MHQANVYVARFFILNLDISLYLIEKVVVHEATKGADGSRMQEVEIYYRFIGKIE